jgi:hypothetical protein
MFAAGVYQVEVAREVCPVQALTDLHGTSAIFARLGDRNPIEQPLIALGVGSKDSIKSHQSG